MSNSDVLVLLLQTGTVLAGALVLMIAARHRAAVRVFTGRVALLAVLAMIVGFPWLRQRQNPVVPVRLEPAPTVDEPSPRQMLKSVQPSSSASAIPMEVPVASHASSDVSPAMRFDPIWIWFLGSALLAIQLGVGVAQLAQIRRSSKQVTNQRAMQLVAYHADIARVNIPLLLEGSLVRQPFVAGGIRPCIFLPAGWANDADEGSLDLILQHEIAHIAHRDLRWHLLHRIMTVAFWPQPFLWLLRRPLVQACEELCDGRVLASGVQSERYAECLLALRERMARAPAPTLAIGAISSRSSFARRVEAVLDSRFSRAVKVSRTMGIALRIGAIVAILGAAYVFARPMPSAKPLVAKTTTQHRNPFNDPYSTSIAIADPSGKPVHDASAWLLLDIEDSPVDLKPVTITNGVVEVEEASLSGYRRARLIVKAPGCGLYIHYVWPNRTKLTTAKLAKSAAVEGRLVGADGRDVSGVRVMVCEVLCPVPESNGMASYNHPLPAEIGSLLASMTDAQGKYRIEGIEPGTTVGLRPDEDRFAHFSQKDQIKAEKPGTNHANDIHLLPAAQVSGTILKDGKPMEGVHVFATEDQRYVAEGDVDVPSEETISDKDGRYVFKGLRPSWYKVEPQMTSTLAESVAAKAIWGIHVPEGTNQTADFKLVPGVLVSGRVVDEKGRAVPGAQITLLDGNAMDPTFATVKTDDKGAYRLKALPGERYISATSQAPMFAYTSRMVNVPNATTFKADLRLGERQNPIPERPIPPSYPSKPKNASFGDGPAFYGPARLKTGGVVRLAFLQDDSWGPHHIWRPDGSAAGKTQTAQSLDMGGFSGGSAKGSRSLYARIEVDGIPRGSYDCVVQVPQPSNRTIYQTYGDQRGKALDMAMFRAAVDLATCDMRFGISSGRYHTVRRFKPGDALYRAKLANYKPNGMIAGGGATPSIDVALDLPSKFGFWPNQTPPYREVQVRAFDRKGHELPYMERDDFERTKATFHCVFGFGGGRPEDVDHFELCTRDYEWITFRKIRLYSDADR